MYICVYIYVYVYIYTPIDVFTHGSRFAGAVPRFLEMNLMGILWVSCILGVEPVNPKP